MLFKNLFRFYWMLMDMCSPKFDIQLQFVIIAVQSFDAMIFFLKKVLPNVQSDIHFARRNIVSTEQYLRLLFCFYFVFLLLYFFFALFFLFLLLFVFSFFIGCYFCTILTRNIFFIIQHFSTTIFQRLQVVISFYSDITEDCRIQGYSFDCNSRIFAKILSLLWPFEGCWLFVHTRRLLHALILLSLYFSKMTLT